MKTAPRRRTPATACRRCRSWPSSSTAGTGSSASRRSSCRCGTWPRAYGCPPDEIEHAVHEQFRAYRATLRDDRRHLLERFEVVDMARKVVGVGSVGTRAFIVLLQGRDAAGPAVPAGQGGDRARCWRTTCRRAGTTSRASGSCRASG